MFDRMFKNWKTSVGGVVLGLAQWAATTNFNFNIGELLNAVPVVLFGLFVTDAKPKK